MKADTKKVERDEGRKSNKAVIKANVIPRVMVVTREDDGDCERWTHLLGDARLPAEDWIRARNCIIAKLRLKYQIPDEAIGIGNGWRDESVWKVLTRELAQEDNTEARVSFSLELLTFIVAHGPFDAIQSMEETFAAVMSALKNPESPQTVEHCASFVRVAISKHDGAMWQDWTLKMILHDALVSLTLAIDPNDISPKQHALIPALRVVLRFVLRAHRLQDREYRQPLKILLESPQVLPSIYREVSRLMVALKDVKFAEWFAANAFSSRCLRPGNAFGEQRRSMAQAHLAIARHYFLKWRKMPEEVVASLKNRLWVKRDAVDTEGYQLHEMYSHIFERQLAREVRRGIRSMASLEAPLAPSKDDVARWGEYKRALALTQTQKLALARKRRLLLLLWKLAMLWDAHSDCQNLKKRLNELSGGKLANWHRTAKHFRALYKLYRARLASEVIALEPSPHSPLRTSNPSSIVASVSSSELLAVAESMTSAASTSSTTGISSASSPSETVKEERVSDYDDEKVELDDDGLPALPRSSSSSDSDSDEDSENDADDEKDNVDEESANNQEKRFMRHAKALLEQTFSDDDDKEGKTKENDWLPDDYDDYLF